MSAQSVAAPSADSEDSLPGKIDLGKLSKDTSHALEKLTPFYIEGTKRLEIKEVTTSYVRAINGSIDASKFGYTLAEEAIGVTNYILKEGKLTPDLDDYTSTASELAAKGKDKAAGAVELFLDARKKLNELISKYDNADEVKDQDEETSKDCLDALKSLQSALDQYMNWWSETEMKHSLIHDRTQSTFNNIRYHTILDESQDLRERYVEYKETIRLAERDVPETFKAGVTAPSIAPLTSSPV